MSKAFTNETDLARPLVAWLREQHWEVYQEVKCGPLERTADIVATFGALTWIVETKLTFGLAVLEQAHYWRTFANFVSVAIPRRDRLARSAASSDRRRRDFGFELCRRLGVGCLLIDPYGDVSIGVRCILNRHLYGIGIRNYIHVAQKTFAEAGSRGGAAWSPYKETCRAVLTHVLKHGPTQVKAVVAAIQHHYSSDATARSCLLKWAKHGSIEGVELVCDGRKLLLKVKEESRCGSGS